MFRHVYKTYPKQFKTRELMEPVFQRGELIYETPALNMIREQALKNLEGLDAAYKRFHNPHRYHVSLSPTLFAAKQRLLRDAAKTGTTISEP